MSARLLFACTLLAFSACGDDGGSGTVDAPKAPDAKTATVMEVTCPATPAATITTLATRFDPMTTTITAGQIVKFVSTPSHPVGPAPTGNTDPGIVVGETKTACLMFTATGSFDFICTVHFYKGTITVN